MSPEEVRKWAIGLLRMEVEFNEKAGVAPIEKRVSMIFREEGLPESGNIFDTSFEEMKRIFDV
jgi:aldehyde:ferredoxin oxidoreductase